jgi:DNA-binding NarL/FixJ family response regulator
MEAPQASGRSREIAPGAWRTAGEPPAASARLNDLTDREKEVLDLLTQGCTNRQIAEQLAISANTVKKHVDHILQKLGVSNRSAAVAMALRGEIAGV